MASPDLLSLTKHSMYNIPGADLCFLVQNVHFRVHRYFFERESGYFIDKLASPASPGQQPRGTQESNAILLDNVSVEDFTLFLWIFYNPRYSLYETSIANWETILKLAVRWQFPEVKNLAVRELEKKDIPDARRIKLYTENKVDRNILIPRYAALCTRQARLTLEEGQDLGMEVLVTIAAAREEVRLVTGGRSPLSAGTDEELYKIIREFFRIAPEHASTKDTDTTGGLPPLRTKKSTAPTLMLQPTFPDPAMIQKSTSPLKNQQSSDLSRKASAVQNLGGVVSDASPFESNMNTTRGNTGIGTTGDLFGISFTDFNQTPPTNVPSFPAFGAEWQF